MTSTEFDDDANAGALSASDLKALECVERQEEMDAIATFTNHAEFPQVAATYVHQAPGTGGSPLALTCEERTRVANNAQNALM